MDLLNTVAIKVPTFWPDSAIAWFVQTKAQFALKGVTVSSTKFIKSPPAHELFAIDDHQRYEAICSLPLSGGMKLSKLMFWHLSQTHSRATGLHTWMLCSVLQRIYSSRLYFLYCVLKFWLFLIKVCLYLYNFIAL